MKHYTALCRASEELLAFCEGKSDCAVFTASETCSWSHVLVHADSGGSWALFFDVSDYSVRLGLIFGTLGDLVHGLNTLAEIARMSSDEQAADDAERILNGIGASTRSLAIRLLAIVS